MKRLLTGAVAIALLGALPVFAKGNAKNGQAKAAQICAACHGPDGNKPSDPTQPILAGQHYDYLVRARAAGLVAGRQRR